MRYYYLAMDYNGWCVFSCWANEPDGLRFMDYPFVTTCPDVALRMCDIFRARNKDVVSHWDLLDLTNPQKFPTLSQFINHWTEAKKQADARMERK